MRRAVARHACAGLALQAAFEHEFLLLRRRDSGLEHMEESLYASAHGLNRAGRVLDAIAAALEAQGVPVRAMLEEAGLSQFELSTEHSAPCSPPIASQIVREIIGAVARSTGWRAPACRRSSPTRPAAARTSTSWRPSIRFGVALVQVLAQSLVRREQA